jgi:type IV fimbrial biogenesis protein FimT
MLNAALRLRRGFTVVELMITVAVLAVGASLAAPGAATMLANRKVQGAAQSILEGLHQARGEAMRRNTPVRFTLAGTGWTMVSPGSGDTLRSFASSDWSSLTITPTGGSAVTFLPTGLLQTGAQLSQVTVASPVDDSRTRRINIFGGGLIRMCDPAVTAADDPRRC